MPILVCVVSPTNRLEVPAAFCIWKEVVLLALFWKRAVPLAVKVLPLATVALPLKLMLPVPVANVPLEPDWSKLPLPAVNVRFLFAAIEVLPFSETLPVPVAKVPVLADWLKLPPPAVNVRFLFAATVVAWLRFMPAVALFVPIEIVVVPDGLSSSGVRRLVLARPLPLIRKSADWSEALWFWM